MSFRTGVGENFRAATFDVDLNDYPVPYANKAGSARMVGMGDRDPNSQGTIVEFQAGALWQSRVRKILSSGTTLAPTDIVLINTSIG